MSPRKYQLLLAAGQRLEAARDESAGKSAIPCRHSLRERCFNLPLPIQMRHSREPSRSPLRPPTTISLAQVARWLWLATGLLRRKLDIDWNGSAGEVIDSKPLFARGSPSAGSLYPIEIHLVTKGVLGLDDGVYQYAEGHASLWRLRSGSFSDELCGLVGEVAHLGSVHLVLVGRYWKTTFKYGAFGYQTMTQDVGAVLESLLRLITDDGFRPLARYQFPDCNVDELVGVDGIEATSLVIVRVECGTPLLLGPVPAEPFALPLGPISRYGPHANSGPVPALVVEVHALSKERLADPPNPHRHTSVIDPNDDASTYLPPAGPRVRRLDYKMMIARRSAMGLQSSSRPIAVAKLLVLLRDVFVPYKSDVRDESGQPASVRAVVLARRISGINPGLYNFCEKEGELDLNYWGGDLPMPQKFYRLKNYNLDNNAAFIFVVGQQRITWKRWRARSLRICNAETGMLAQRTYLNCASRGWSCGAMLGLEIPEVDRFLRLKRGRESTLLGLSLGWPLQTRAAFIANFY